MAKRKLADYQEIEGGLNRSRSSSRSTDIQNHDEVDLASKTAVQRSSQGLSISNPSKRKSKLIAALDNFLAKGSEDVDEEMLSQCVELKRTLQKQSNHNQSKNPPKLIEENHKAPSDLSFNRKALHDTLGSLAALSPWTKSSIPPLGYLPTPPLIKDTSFQKSTFTHSSSVTTNDNNASYERLEWLGDAYIYLFSTHLIYHTFPSHPPGRMAQLRERIVKNETLASYARAYNFHKNIALPPEHRNLPFESKQLIKIFGDVFEAYAGAAILSDPDRGLSDVAIWMKNLWAGTLASDIMAQERRNASAEALAPSSDSSIATSSKISLGNLPAKDRLQARIGCKGMKLYYKECAPEKKDRHLGLPLYTVGLFLDDSNEDGVVGKQMTFGSGLSKKDAGHKAAEMMLANKKMMKMYEDRKRRFDEQTRKQKEAAEASASSVVR